MFSYLVCSPVIFDAITSMFKALQILLPVSFDNDSWVQCLKILENFLYNILFHFTVHDNNNLIKVIQEATEVKCTFKI